MFRKKRFGRRRNFRNRYFRRTGFKRFRKKVKNVLKNVSETKISTEVNAATLLFLSGTFGVVNSCVDGFINQGIRKDQRIGKKVQTKRLTVTMVWQVSAGNPDVPNGILCRAVMVQPRTANAIATADFGGLHGPNNPEKFRTIKEWQFNLGDGSDQASWPSQKRIVYSFPWKVNWKWDADSDTAQGDPTKEIKIFFIPVHTPLSTNISVSIQTQYTARISYVDV